MTATPFTIRRTVRTQGQIVMTGKVGFVGVGAMGGPMALNLVKAGVEVIRAGSSTPPLAFASSRAFTCCPRTGV
jgi:hypothetical protein